MSGSLDDTTVDIGPDGTICVDGDIDMAAGPQLEVVILQREASGPLTVDLAGVHFIDSSGLRVLLGAGRRAAQRGERVTLRSVGPEVARLLEITGTTDQFDIDGFVD